MPSVSPLLFPPLTPAEWAPGLLLPIWSWGWRKEGGWRDGRRGGMVANLGRVLWSALQLREVQSFYPWFSFLTPSTSCPLSIHPSLTFCLSFVLLSLSLHLCPSPSLLFLCEKGWKSPLIHSFSQGYFFLTVRRKGGEGGKGEEGWLGCWLGWCGGGWGGVGWGGASDAISQAQSSMWADQSVCWAPSLIRNVGLIKSYHRTETTHTHAGPHFPYLSAGEIISDAPLPEHKHKVVCVHTSKAPHQSKCDLEQG